MGAMDIDRAALVDEVVAGDGKAIAWVSRAGAVRARLEAAGNDGEKVKQVLICAGGRVHFMIPAADADEFEEDLWMESGRLRVGYWWMSPREGDPVIPNWIVGYGDCRRQGQKRRRCSPRSSPGRRGAHLLRSAGRQ